MYITTNVLIFELPNVMSHIIELSKKKNVIMYGYYKNE